MKDIMADFTVKAIRTGDKTHSVTLEIHDGDVVTIAKDLPLYDQTYEACFDTVHDIITKRSNS